jgi:PEP-CTERM motif
MKYIKPFVLSVILGIFATVRATTLSDFSPFISTDTVTRGFATGGGWSFNQNPTSVDVSGSDNTSNYVDYYFGDVGVSISLAVNTNLALTANTLADNTASAFKINLSDTSNVNFAYYTVTTSLLSSSASATPVILSVGNVDSGFDWNHVQGFKLVGLSQTFDTDKKLSISFDNLSTSAIPEPSTYAALFGLGALGLSAVRRRRKVA